MSKASDAAQQFLWEIGYNDVVDQDLTELVLSLGVYYEELPLVGCEGMLLYTNSGETVKIIVNKDTKYVPRKRFSIAHEIGHYLLGHMNHFHYDNDGTLNIYRKGSQEAEANEFASELLMPTPAFMNVVDGKKFSPKLVQNVADEFGASISSVLYRYVKCGPQPVAVVYSYRGTVEWMRKSRSLKRRMLDWERLDVPKNSLSEEFFLNPMCFDGRLDHVEDVPLGVWFDSGPGVCHEYCFTSPFGGALSVIWED